MNSLLIDLAGNCLYYTVCLSCRYLSQPFLALLPCQFFFPMAAKLTLTYHSTSYPLKKLPADHILILVPMVMYISQYIYALHFAGVNVLTTESLNLT